MIVFIFFMISFSSCVYSSLGMGVWSSLWLID